MRRLFSHSRIVVSILIGAVSVAQATNIAWINPLGGNFTTGTNWLGALAPGAGDVALLDTLGLNPYTATFSASVSNSQLFVADNVTFDLQGKTYTLGDAVYTTGVYSADIGSLTGGTLNLQSSGNTVGTLSTVYAAVGALLGDSGSARVSGSYTAWTDAKTLYIGDAGNGSLSIQNGASVSDLAGSIGNAVTGVGTATIDGAGSVWTNANYLYVGAHGTGSLTIQNGGKVVSGATYIGQYGTGSATITGATSIWTPTYLDIAYNNSGNLTIANGATVNDSDVYISSAVNSPAIVNVSGASSTWTTSDTMYVGMASAATFNISGGSVSVARTFGIGNKPGTQVSLSGGTLSVGTLNTSGNPALFLGNGVSTGWTGGTLNITASDLSVSTTGPLGANLTVGSGKNLQVSGVGHTLALSAGATLNAGGGSVYANTLNNAGTLVVPVGSTVEAANAATNTGLIDVSGGTLQLDTGLSGASIRTQILSGYDKGEWDGTTGITSTLARTATVHGTGLAYVTTGSTTKISYTWYGDTNGDGVVNAADTAAMSVTGTTWQTGDFNYDGVVNEDDWSLLFLGSLFGTSNIANLIPEPTSMVMLLPMAGLVRRGRRCK